MKANLFSFSVATAAFRNPNFENGDSAIKSDKDALDAEPWRVQPLFAQELTDKKDQLLALFDIDDLPRKITRRMLGSKEPKE